MHRIDQTTEQMIRGVLAYAENRLRMDPVPLDQGTLTSSELYARLDGVIVSCDDDSFVARLYEDASDYPVMEAEFATEDVATAERNLVVEGAQLVWTISYRHEGGTRFREGTVYLKRGALTDAELFVASERTSHLLNAINWNDTAATDQSAADCRADRQPHDSNVANHSATAVAVGRSD